jgi:hypothetical protein
MDATSDFFCATLHSTSLTRSPTPWFIPCLTPIRASIVNASLIFRVACAIAHHGVDRLGKNSIVSNGQEFNGVNGKRKTVEHVI